MERPLCRGDSSDEPVRSGQLTGIQPSKPANALYLLLPQTDWGQIFWPHACLLLVPWYRGSGLLSLKIIKMNSIIKITNFSSLSSS